MLIAHQDNAMPIVQVDYSLITQLENALVRAIQVFNYTKIVLPINVFIYALLYLIQLMQTLQQKPV